MRIKKVKKEGVYKLFRNGELIYIGQSQDMEKRIRSHAANGRQFDSFELIKCEGKSRRMELEKELIRTHKPPQNGTSRPATKVRMVTEVIDRSEAQSKYLEEASFRNAVNAISAVSRLWLPTVVLPTIVKANRSETARSAAREGAGSEALI